MTIHDRIEAKILTALSALAAEGLIPREVIPASVELEAPRDPTHGDIATNVAMVLAKPARKPPRDIAQALVAKLSGDPDIASAQVAGPGFINLTLQPGLWQSVLGAILREGDKFALSSAGKAEKVNVEYVSANPTGPMHVGHCRGAVFGDALANLLDAVGFNVAREYYVNDAGGQIIVLARSAFLRYREALGEKIGDIPEGLYPGDYLKPVGAALAKAHGAKLKALPEAQWLPIVRKAAVEAMLATIKEDLAALEIRHETFFSEASLQTPGDDKVKAAIDLLRAKGLVYEGRLERPKGHDDEEWEDREQTLFKSTAFGDDVDRALMKSDGTYTYFASDIAYHLTKIERGYRHLINVFGADHVGYIKRMMATVAALSDRKVDLDVKVCQLVRLLRAGEPVKMSKRAGTFVTLREVVDEVGADATRFMMLFRKNDATLDFDLAKVREMSKDNPVFYVQYAHARSASAFRRAGEVFPGTAPESPALASADLAQLGDPGELDLMRRLAAFPRLVESAARAHEPHRLAFYLHDLASSFHSQWTRGDKTPQLRFTQPDDRGLTMARLALVAATKQVLKTGLRILGVRAPEEMR